MGAIENTEGIVVQRTRQVPVGVPNWGAVAVIGMFAGMLYGGSKEASASVSKDAEVMLKLDSTPDKRAQYRLMRDAMEKRFIRVTCGSIVGGGRLEMFSGCFCGLQNLLAEKRGVHDVLNVVVAGSGTAATFGLIFARITHVAAKECDVGICFGCRNLLPSWLASSEASGESKRRVNGYCCC